MSSIIDSRFEAKPTEAEIAEALATWPELAGLRIRPLFVSAFGDIYVETSDGEVLVADPLELSCDRVAGSVSELKALFQDSAWAQERLITELAECLELASHAGVIARRQRHYGR